MTWQAFFDAVVEENQRVADLGWAALVLTDALVVNDAEAIEHAERRVEAQRVLLLHAHGHRMTMQQHGFGAVPLKTVCSYAPAPLRKELHGIVHELTTRGIALQMTVNNNKALILAGMERLTKTVAVLQQAVTEQPGTYKRRGVVPPSNGSVIVSRKA